MFKFLKSTQRQARRLNRDAVTIIAADCRDHNAKRLKQIAQQTEEYLQQAQVRMKNDPDADYRNLAYLQTEHKKARHQPNQIALSAVTLAIIYSQAQKLGDHCQPALDAIERFIKQRSE